MSDKKFITELKEILSNSMPNSWSKQAYVQVFSSAFPRSTIGLSIVLHLDGPFAPPKVSISDMRTHNFPIQLI